MNLYGRLLFLMLKALFSRGKFDLNKKVRTRFHVLPHDLDLNLHMNNGRYLTLMDLGRFDFLVENGLFFACMKRGWLPVLGEAQMVYFRPLNPFDSFHIETSLEAWDDKWFLISQKFMRKNQVMAYGIIRGLFTGSQGQIPPQEILKLSKEITAQNVQAPKIEGSIKAWEEHINEIRQRISQENKAARGNSP